MWVSDKKLGESLSLSGPQLPTQKTPRIIQRCWEISQKRLLSAVATREKAHCNLICVYLYISKSEQEV
jgi:hypothetical protein